MAVDQGLKSRRALLAGALGGLGALAATALGRPPGAQAGGSFVVLGQDNSASLPTRIKSTSAGQPAFIGYKLNAGDAVWGVSGTGKGVYGESDSSNGVHGASTSGHGVLGTSKTGFGVFAESTGAGWTSIAALKENAGIGISAVIVDPGSIYSAIEGNTVGGGSAIYGESDLGRGGRFRGKKAQIRLDPSAAATHPASGQAGDIFLDASKRLWLCKGGSSWVRIV